MMLQKLEAAAMLIASVQRWEGGHIAQEAASQIAGDGIASTGAFMRTLLGGSCADLFHNSTASKLIFLYSRE
jgi:hypothetical protein